MGIIKSPIYPLTAIKRMNNARPTEHVVKAMESLDRVPTSLLKPRRGDRNIAGNYANMKELSPNE
jgi:hypothetical protein